MKYFKYIMLGIVVLSFLLRFIGLDLVPANLSNDEASIAYDAHSISQTLRDEHNHFLPLSFQSHNTYKAPLTIYISVPFIKLLGNNDYAIRLPSAILGTLTVLFLGLLVYELTKNHILTVITSLTLAITPWHIYSSRMILESNIALFFVVAGLYLFYKGINSEKNVWTILSFVSFALSIYSYHTQWLYTPLLIATVLILNFSKLKNKKFYLVCVSVFVLISMPIYLETFIFPSETRRSSSELFINDPHLHDQLYNSSYNFAQKSALVAKRLLDNYSEYLNLGYLFFNGLGFSLFLSDFRTLVEKPPIPVGLFLQIFLPFFIYGLVNLKKVYQSNYKDILAILIITPIVPALTLGGLNSVRYLIAIIPIVLIISAGFYLFYQKYKTSKVIKVSYILISVSFVYFAFAYYFQFTISSRYNYLYNYKEISNFIKIHNNEYDRVVVDSKFGDAYYFHGVPHLYLGFYGAIDAQNFLDTRRDGDKGLTFSKFVTGTVLWDDEINSRKENGKSLIVAPISNSPPDRLKDKFEIIKTTYFPNKSPSFYFYIIKD